LQIIKNINDMRKFNFLSKSSSQSCGHSSVTLASTVGSPSVHRRGTMLKLLSVLVLIFTFGIGQMWGAGANNLATYTFDNGTTMPTNVTRSGGASFATNRFCFSSQNDHIIITPTIPDGATTLYIQVKGLMNNSGTETTAGTIGIYGLTSTNGAVAGASGTFSQSQGAMTNIQSVDNGVVDETEISFPAKDVAKIKINEDAHNKKYVIKSVTITYDACSNSVSLSTGTSTNASLLLGKTSIETCSANNADREVEITVTPSTCYTLPSSTRLDFTGVSATYVSGPNNNNKFVYRFAQNAKGNSTVTVSLSTKTTYTVSYNKGTYGTGNNDSGTKTCGETLTLPNSAMFTREGYTQKGWSTAQAGNTKTNDLGGSYTNNSATTLYPYWEANDCTITWVVDGEPWNHGGSTTAKYDGKVANLPTAPTKDDGCGDKFMGWTSNNIGEAVLDKTDDAATITSLNCFKDVDGSPVIQGTTTFYAVFATYVKK
jgi:hypothetical protein